MKPLQAVVAICLVLAIGARSETLENTKESTKDVISESEQSEPQARAERCTTCSGGVKLSFKSPNDVLAAIQALPGGEVHTQQSFEGCSSDKGCAGLKVKDGRVVEKFGNVDAFQAAAAADTGNEFQFHAGGGLGNVFEGGIPDGGPFWWMNQNSPFKNGAAGGNFEKFSKSSSSFTSSGTAGAGGVDIAANPFLNGDFSKLAGGFGAGAESKPGFSSSSFESSSFSSSSKGDVDISKNPFLNGGVKFGQNGFAAQGGFGAGSAQFGAGAAGAGQSGAGQAASQFGASQSAFSASNNAFGAQGSQGAGAGNSGLTSGSAQGGAFGGGFSGSAFNAASNKFGASGYTGSSPSPFTASTGSNVNLIQSSQKGSEFDFEQQQQTQQNIDEAFQSTGNVHAHEHSGGDLQQTCAGQGYVCVHKAQCNNGVVNTNGAGVIQARTQKQYCNTRTEICCRIEVSSVGAGSVQGSSSFGAQGSQSAFGATNNRGTSKFGVSGSVGTGLAPPANKINNVYKSTSQSNFVETDSFSAGSEVAGVFRPGAGPGLKPGIPYLPPVDTVTQPSFISSTSVPFTTTPKPFVPVRPPVTPPRPYLPPVTVTTSTSAPGYLPPDVVPGESKDPPPYYVTGSLLKEPFLTTPSPAIPDTPSGCAAALKCTPIEFCTAEGVISTTAVVLTRDQEAYRVPLTDCKDVGTGTIGKCCRDPLYTDPWPTNQLGKWVPGVFGGNDGKYVPDSNPQSNNPRGQVTGRPPVTGSVIRNEYKPSTPGPYGPNQVTPGFPSSTVSSFKGQGSVTSFGQGQYSQGGVGQYSKGGQGQYTVGGQGQYTVGGQGQVTQGGKTQFVQREQTQFGQGGQGQVGIGGQGQVGIGGQGQFGIGQQGQIGIQQGGGQTQTAQGTQFSTNTQSFGQKGQGQVVRQGQGSYVEQGQGGFGVGGRGQYTVGGQGQLEIGGGGAQGQFTQVQGETQKTFNQGSGFGIGIGQGQTGFGISTGFGQGVIQGQGQGVRQGFGSAIQQGFGQAIVQGEGETSASEGVYRVFLGRYSGGNGQCGLLNGQKPYGNRNDLEVDFAEIPWQAMVLLQTNRSLLCGGVITRPDVVVTSASCVDGLDAKNVLIKGGEWKLGVDDEPLPFQIVQVKTIVKHPYYKIGSLKNDAAILVLSENLRLAKNIQPICLPESGETLDAFYNGAGECIVTGWGKQVLQAHLAGSIMHSLNVSLLNPGECQAKLSSDYPHLLEQYDQDSCACGQPLNPVNNICKVDIGSALACTTDNSHYVLRGLYSWDSGCQTGNQIAAFYKFDLEWYEWAIGLIESTRFAKFAIGSKVTQNRFSSQIKGSSSQFGGSSQYNSGVKGVTSSGIKGGVKGAGFQEQTGGLIAGAFQGSSATASATTGSSGTGFGSGISGSGFGNGAGFGSGAGFEGSAIKGGFGTGQFGFSQFGSSSKFTEGSANGGLVQSEIKGPISNSFSATYSEKKVFQTEPKIITYTTKPEIVTFTTKPEIVTFTTKPEYFTFTTKPKIVTYTTKPQIITYETSGSGTNPQYVAPGVTFNPSFGEAAGLHKHNAQCKCLEKGKK
ncbi:uncharacterized protein LOC135085654 [Ostrinia nubilalis]|uniref:uncharacterized protein LOC135085654 n=1 Tax=Ostrinia nubilalis TaxID=29057 RepID=UPI00308265C3